MTSTTTLSPERLAAANINPASFLATDYLNHFNEVVMLIEMVADMPDMAEDVLEWEPRSYCEHFKQSVFADKDLAVLAYTQAPDEPRTRFEAVVDELNGWIGEMQILLSGLSPDEPLDPAVSDRLTSIIAGEIRPAIDRASAIINGTDSTRVEAPLPVSETSMRAQDAVDQLFS
ncbi:MAG: hypothetical protein AAF739_00685 [Pseudomonadota bacterium]